MAMADTYEDGELDFEQGMLWLPSHVLDEACDITTTNRRRTHKKPQHLQHTQKSPSEPASPVKVHDKTGSRSYPRRKCPSNRSSGGPGMQAIFLGSGLGSGGTGVFLPQSTGNHFQPSSRAACAPVLVPARVVQALKLDVHALGLQISPRQEPNKCPNCQSVQIPAGSKSDQEWARATQSCLSLQSGRGSPELFLPKEWTY